MAFKRALQPISAPEDAEALTAAMAEIGMGFAAAPAPDPSIEDTLLLASIAAIEGHDLRALDLLSPWFGIHAPWVLADRLTRLVAARGPRVRALWAALARGRAADRRFARLAAGYRGRRLDVLPVGTAFQIGRHGEAPRFAGGPLRVPANLLRGRPADVQTPSELTRRHRAYRCRIQIGPGYRADMRAALEADPTLSAAALARKTYGSFATAWHVRRDFALLQSPGRQTPPPLRKVPRASPPSKLSQPRRWRQPRRARVVPARRRAGLAAIRDRSRIAASGSSSLRSDRVAGFVGICTSWQQRRSIPRRIT